MRVLLASLGLTAAVATAQPALTPSKWELIEPKMQRKPVLTLDQGRFSLRVCNTIGGAFQVEGSHLISQGGAASTMMVCPGDDPKVEQALTRALTDNQSFELNRDLLTLVSQSGDRYVFRRLPMPSANAVTKLIYVASALADCSGVAPMKCLQVRDSKDQPWRLHHGPIVGFDFVPGTEYRLRIKEDKIGNAPADAPDVRWYLDLVVERRVVDPKATPPVVLKVDP